jgi:hypothetical protein
VNASLHKLRNAFWFVWPAQLMEKHKTYLSFWKAYEETEKELLLLDREPRYITTILFYQTRVNLLLSPFYFICLIFIFWFNVCSFTEVLLSLGIMATGFLLHRHLDRVCHFARYMPFTQPASSCFIFICCLVKSLGCVCLVGEEHKMFGEFKLNDRL